MTRRGWRAADRVVGSRATSRQAPALRERSLVAEVDAPSAGAAGRPRTTALRPELVALDGDHIGNGARTTLLQAVRRLPGS